mgnify:CR=1 FL=1
MLVLPERERTKKGAIGVETKGVTCKIPLDLHNQISEEIRETESTMSKFIEMIIREHYEKGANRIMEKGRTLAFQVSEELFQRVKEYLENYEKTYHRRLTQKEFVISLIEQALEEAEEEFEAARAAEHEEQAENGWEAAEIAESMRTRKYPMTRNQRTGTKKMAKPRDSVLMKKQPGAAGNLQKTPKPVRARKNPARTMRILHRKAGIRMRKKKPSRMTIP